MILTALLLLAALRIGFLWGQNVADAAWQELIDRSRP